LKRIACAAIFVVVLASFGFAEGSKSGTSLELQGDYEFPNHEAVDANGLVPIVYGISAGASGERDVGSSWGGAEAKAIIDHKLVFPVFAGESALTRDNNIALDLSGEISPVSLNANFQATLSPIAFLKFAAGAGVGTGWSIGFVGLGINDAGTIEPQNFGGLVYRAWVEATFQFDLAAVMPGMWNHVVILASPKIQYQAYTGASSDQAWIWEADHGMNFNGTKLTGSYLLGYQMPIALNLAGLLLQTEGWLGSVRDLSPKASGWGSDFSYLTFGPLFDFKIGDRSTIAVLPQFKTGIQWTDSTKRKLNFMDRVYADSYTYFYRIAIDYTLEL